MSGGSDFCAYISAIYPPLSSDASRAFSYGSSVFSSALRAVASSVPLPPMSSELLSPPLALQLLSFRLLLSPLPLLSLSLLLSILGCLRWVGGCLRLGSTRVVAQAPPGFPPLSAPSVLLSVPPPAVPPSSVSPSRPPGVSVLSPSASSLLSLRGLSLPLMLWAPFWWFGDSTVAFGSSHFSVAPFLLSLTLRCCPLPQLSLCSALLRWAPLLVLGFASSSTGSTFGPDGSAPQPGPSSAFPPLSGASTTPSAPPLSEFDYGPVDPFAPGFVDPDAPDAAAPDPEAPIPPPLSASARAEVRHMYQCLVDLLPQAAGSSQAPRPPCALFVEFFDAPSSPLHPVLLSWSSLLQPSRLWGLFVVGSGVCLWCHRHLCCASLSFLMDACLYPSGSWGLSSGFALSRFRGGVQLFCFPVAPSQSVLPDLSGALGGLPGSLLCLPPGYGSSCFHGSLWFGLVLQLPSMRAPRLASLRPLGYSTGSYLGSRRYVLSSTLVFSVTLPVGSSWAPLSRFSWSWGFLQSVVVFSASWSCLRGPLECIFLLLSPRGLPLVSVSCFFFPGPPCVTGFLLFFWPSCPSVSSLCQSGAVFWASCPFGCCGSRFSHPLAVSHISPPCLCSCLSQGFLWLGWFRPPYSSVVLPHWDVCLVLPAVDA